jgi:hypothetical protein
MDSPSPPPETEAIYIKRAKIRITPNGRVNRRSAALILDRSEKTLANWASKGIGPQITMVGGRAFYDYAECVAFRDFRKD